MQGHDTDRYFDGACYVVTCVECSRRFESKRSDASFCSSRCRVAYSRRPAKIAWAVNHIQAIGREMLSLSVRYRKNKLIFNAMVELRRVLDVAIANFEE